MVPIGIPTICWYTMPSNCTYMFSIRKVKASHNSAQDQHLYESYFLLLKTPALTEVQRYVFDSLLKHQLTRDNTFALIRSCGNEVYKVEKVERRYLRTPKVTQSQLFDDLGRVFNGPKIIDITIAKSSFTVLNNMIFDSCQSRCNMLRKNGSRAVTWIWYKTWFIRTFV